MKRVGVSGVFGALVCISLPGWGQPAAPQPSAAGDWIVVGLRRPEEASSGALVEEFRKALASELGPKGSASVVGGPALLGRLGASSAPVAALLSRITDAEGAYQEFALDAAREKFLAGIRELGAVAGEPSVWEASMTAHVLLAMVYLAAQERDAAAHAQAELESIYRVAPEFRASGYSSDPLFLALARKADEKVRRLPRGAVRVAAASGRGPVHVWVDTAPKGPQERLELPVGTYRVRVTDASEAPSLRSFTRSVTVAQGKEVLLSVHLPIEGALDASGGPAFALPASSDLRAELPAVLGERVGTGHLAFVWVDGQSNLRMALGDAATGRLDRAVAAPGPTATERASALSDLAAYAASGRVAPGLVEVEPTLGDLLHSLARRPALVTAAPSLPPLEEVSAARGPWLRIGGWASAGVAGAALIAGAVLQGLAASGQAALDDPYRRGSVVWVPYPEQPSYASQRRDQAVLASWGVSLLVSAAVTAALSGTLFALDAWMPGRTDGMGSGAAVEAWSVGFKF